MPRKKIYLPILLAFVLLLNFLDLKNDSPAQASSDLNVALTVKEQSGENRTADPVTSGIPLPESAGITGENSLALFDANGNFVPAQFRVLSRWNGLVNDRTKAIKWVQVDFQADAAVNSEAKYYLKNSGSQTVYGISANEDAAAINIDTGVLHIVVPKSGYNLFSEIKYSGQADNLIKPNNNSLIIRRNDKIYKSYIDSAQIEENGAMRSSVLIKGHFQTDSGEKFVGGDARMYVPGAGIAPAAENYPLTFTVRVRAYKNKSYLKVDYTLENNGNSLAYYYPTNDVFIDGNYFNISPDFGSSVTAVMNGSRTSLAAGDGLFLYQSHRITSANDELKNFNFSLNKNGQQIYNGQRSDGWIDFGGGGNYLTLGMKDFWQNYPKSIEFAEGTAKVGILPDTPLAPETSGPFAHYSTGNYYFSGGWHKTTEMFLYFHKTFDAPSAIAKLNSPLFAACDTQWYVDSKAWDLISPAGVLSSDDKKMQDAFDRYEQFQKMFIDGSQDALGRDIEKLRETRNGNKDYYGWENFGDLAWGSDVYSSLHYDWPYIMWLQFIRSGNPEYLTMAEEMTRHSIDLDQIHGGKFYDGIWQFEDTGNSFVNHHHKSTQAAGAIVSHTWNGGYSLGYLLTGDNGYLEAVKSGANAGRNFWSSSSNNAIGGQKVVWDQTRSQGWSILMLVNEYRITGDRKDLDQAMAIFKNSLLYTEQQATTPGSNGHGYITIGYYPSDPSLVGKAVVTFLSYPLEPLCELHYEASKAGYNVSDLESYLTRSLNWLKDYAFVGGKQDVNGNYSLLTITYATDPKNRANNIGGQLAHNIQFAGTFGYMSQVLKNKNPELAQSYMKFAENLFKDLMLYRESPNKTGDKYINPSVYSPVSWGWLPTATKELGYIGRSGQLFLNAEYDRDKIPPSTPSSFGTIAFSPFELDLSWASSTDNVAVAGYKIYSGGKLIATTASLNFSDDDLVPAAIYDYSVIAYDIEGNESQPAAIIAGTPAKTDIIPPKISNIAVSVSQNSAVISWESSEPASVNIFYGLTPDYNILYYNKNYAQNGSMELTGLQASSTYHFIISASDISRNAAETKDEVFVTGAMQ